MFDHISIGVKNLADACCFYDAALRPLGITRLYDGNGTAGYGAKAAQFWLSETAHPVPADSRSGLHICFRADSRDAVDAFHAIALAQGAADNGYPGLRPQYEPNYYAGFVIDPGGYRIEAVCYGE